MDYKKAFPKRLTEVRKERKKTQDEMAIILDISRPAYTQYETGVNFPKLENLVKISETLEISIDYLVGLSNKKKIEK